jgi:hypothetical protein
MDTLIDTEIKRRETKQKHREEVYNKAKVTAKSIGSKVGTVGKNLKKISAPTKMGRAFGNNPFKLK